MLFSIRGKLSSRTDFLIGLAGVTTFVIVWCILTYGGYTDAQGEWQPYVKPLFLPSPSNIWDGLVEFHQKNWLLPAI